MFACWHQLTSAQNHEEAIVSFDRVTVLVLRHAERPSGSLTLCYYSIRLLLSAFSRVLSTLARKA
jgi:hypothetical protein